MKIRALTFDDDEKLEDVTATLTAKEAVYIAKLLGRRNGIESEEFMPGGAEVNSSIYDCLSGGVFNLLYDDGVNEAFRELSA